MENAKDVTQLIRFIAVCVMVPTISIGLVFLLVDPVTHAMHMWAFLILGAAALAVFFAAPQIALRLTRTST
jgi:hypothetical protein